MKKEICLNIHQLIWTTLHRLLRGTRYLFKVGLTQEHSLETEMKLKYSGSHSA